MRILRAPRHTKYRQELQKLYNPCRRPQPTAKYISKNTTKTIHTKTPKKTKDTKKPKKSKTTKKQFSRTPAKLMAHAENSGKLSLFFFVFFGSLAISLVALLVSLALLPAHRESACGLPFVPIKRIHNMFPCCWFLYYVLQYQQYHSMCIDP